MDELSDFRFKNLHDNLLLFEARAATGDSAAAAAVAKLRAQIERDYPSVIQNVIQSSISQKNLGGCAQVIADGPRNSGASSISVAAAPVPRKGRPRKEKPLSEILRCHVTIDERKLIEKKATNWGEGISGYFRKLAQADFGRQSDDFRKALPADQFAVVQEITKNLSHQTGYMNQLLKKVNSGLLPAELGKEVLATRALCISLKAAFLKLGCGE